MAQSINRLSTRQVINNVTSAQPRIPHNITTSTHRTNAGRSRSTSARRTDTRRSRSSSRYRYRTRYFEGRTTPCDCRKTRSQSSHRSGMRQHRSTPETMEPTHRRRPSRPRSQANQYTRIPRVQPRTVRAMPKSKIWNALVKSVRSLFRIIRTRKDPSMTPAPLASAYEGPRGY